MRPLNMSEHSNEPSVKSRKIRKGTHSCRECRRRKVKCVFASPKDVICVVCSRRGTRCISQVVVGTSSEQSPTQLLTPNFPSTPASHASAAPYTEQTAQSTITQALLHALPPRKDIEILLEKVPITAATCYQSNFKNPSATGFPKDQIPVRSLLYPETHPVLLARQMLLFAAALQHISPNAVIHGLTMHHHHIMKELAEVPIRMVTTNDALLGTLEALENIILEGFYHIDSGNIRRAWITLRRAVTVAQLLGLHQPSQQRFKLINDKNDLNPDVMWTCIMSMERMMSLLLGLPSSIAPTTSAVPDQGCDLSTFTMHMSARILQRNQMTNSQAGRHMTSEIDRELLKMTEQLSPSFWRPLSFAGLAVDSVDAVWETRRAWDHMCYYTLVNQLHLPYILCPSHAPHVMYSRMACVNASREILYRENAIRTFNPVTACSRMGDFLALIAGMTLMLAHLVSHSHSETNNLLVHQRLGDRAAVEQALTCMKSMSELLEDVLAAKCSALLKDLLAIEADAARGRHSNSKLIINVPYLGSITITPGGIAAREYIEKGNEQDHDDNSAHPEGITIGGIGSIHVRSPGRPDHPTSDIPSDYVALQPADEQYIDTNQPPEALIAQAIEAPSVDYYYSMPHAAEMFPDAAAGLDDWVFQGFDTAFFDILMRVSGSQDQRLEGVAE